MYYLTLLILHSYNSGMNLAYTGYKAVIFKGRIYNKLEIEHNQTKTSLHLVPRFIIIFLIIMKMTRF
jgi:hypothetical protein